MQVTAADHDRISAAISEAERCTSGEIFTVVEMQPTAYPQTAFTIAVLLAFVVPFAAVLLVGVDPRQAFESGWSSGDAAMDIVRAIEGYAAVQALIFVLALGVLSWTPAGRLLTPRGLRRERVHRVAMAQFLSRGLHVTAERTGVLLFLSLPDQIAEVIADEGIFAKVPPTVWDETVAALVSGAKRGAVADGFVAAIGIAGAVLADHFPPRADNPNELPDRLIEL